MNPKIWTFGDSLTEYFLEDFPWSKKYIDWKGYKPKVYGEFLSEELKLELNNFGKNGADNYTIFQRFCDVSNKIKEEDIVIFGWSSPVRFRIVDFDKWVSILPKTVGDTTKYEFENFSSNSIEEILVNRDSIKFVEEVNSWIKLINNTFKNKKVIHWTAFDKRINGLILKGFETIKTETNGEIEDNHFSERGQYEISKILLSKISGKNKFI